MGMTEGLINSIYWFWLGGIPQFMYLQGRSFVPVQAVFLNNLKGIELQACWSRGNCPLVLASERPESYSLSHRLPSRLGSRNRVCRKCVFGNSRTVCVAISGKITMIHISSRTVDARE